MMIVVILVVVWLSFMLMGIMLVAHLRVLIERLLVLHFDCGVSV